MGTASVSDCQPNLRHIDRIETALRQHEAVLEVALIGLPDTDLGEAVTAIVVQSGSASATDLRDFAKSKLSAYKVPKSILFVDEPPLTT